MKEWENLKTAFDDQIGGTERKQREARVDIKDKLKQFRLNNNLTLEEAAEYTEVSRATLGRIEQGLANPGQATIDKINKGIAKWNVEQIIWGFKDPDDPSFDRYTADEAQDILEFNKYFLSELDLELKLSGNSVEVWAGDAGYRVSIGDLRLIKEQVVKQYTAIFNERFHLVERSKERPMEITCKFYDVKEKLPEKSGEYLCFGGGNYWANLWYSVKHKAFNVFDANEDTEYEIRPYYWAELPDMPEED